MSIQIHSEFQVADTTIRYLVDAQSRRAGLQLIPTAKLAEVAVRREGLRGLPYIDAIPDAGNPPAFVLDPLAQIKIVGDSYPGAFAQGHTMRNSPSVDRFRFHSQRISEQSGQTTVTTVLKSEEGLRIEHRLWWRHGDAAMYVSTSFVNGSPEPVTLEMLSSFSLSGITPFASDDAPERLMIHRFRSVWSAEGRLESRNIEELHLERSWSGAGMFSERFGQLGTMPVRRWFPFVAAEDKVAGVFWGAQLSWAGSWQMEVFRQHDDVCLSGGLADREFGHWMKTVAPGETLVAPEAALACVEGDLDDLCDRLTALQQRAADQQPEIERDLPIVFNEWCTTWGDPQHDKLVAIAKRLKGSETKYLVIDAGWYKSETTNWDTGHGDWVPSTKLFPCGLKATADAIRQEGLIPGLWYEMETVGASSQAFSLVDLLLQRDGMPVTVRGRRFWNLNHPGAVQYLTEKVIDLLDQCSFGYLKIDYNETSGLGCEDPDSLGEGLRKQTYGTYAFFERIRQRLPQLVIENCSSGGHRLEPSMLGRTAMSSFSDAHELVEIPIIAANMHRLMLPRQSQIWAVLHRSDTVERLVYSLAATFLGRMCLSGEIAELSTAQWSLVLEAQRLYRRVAPIIKHGVSRRHGEMNESWRHPKGWQALVRTGATSNEALVVVHTFENAAKKVQVPLPKGHGWRIASEFSTGKAAALTISEGQLVCPVGEDFSARVILLSKQS